MSSKYSLQNIPQGGVAHILPGVGLYNIDENLSDEIIEKFIKLGLTQYFVESQKSIKTTILNPPEDGKAK
jgi:hypothetical protein